MYKVCVFAGTTEGRELITFLQGTGISITACAATEYGGLLLEPQKDLTVKTGRLTEDEMRSFFEEEKFDLVLDATHPYAQIVTDNIARACEAAGTPCLRVLREASRSEGGHVFVSDVWEAVEYLNRTTGNILLTTGSKELSKFSGLNGFGERVFARVLPVESSLAACREAGLRPARILAMQGPFSVEMNLATLRFSEANFLVTKDGGTAGGFAEKEAAAKAAGVKLVVIGRPPEHSGCSLKEAEEFLTEKFSICKTPEVKIVGIGPGRENTMTGEVRDAIRGADCLIGAGRMLEAAGGTQPRFEAIAPAKISELIRGHKEFRRFAVVMSGDTGFFSGTKKLLPMLADCQTEVLPGISSLSCLCARLGTSYEDVKVLSLHGRDGDIVRFVREEKRVFTLVGGENGIRDLCSQLADAGLGSVRVSVGERLGYEDEKITTARAEDLCEGSFASLSAALIENREAHVLVTHGLPDSVFQRKAEGENAVPMTKQEIRSICLSKLELTREAVCWDIGAGTGSVAIEMALQCRDGLVYAVEKKSEALSLLEENREKFGAMNMTVVAGSAPDACRALPAPTHVFIGGSSGNMEQILQTVLEKNPHARIVATAIAVETAAELTRCMHTFAFDYAEVAAVQVARSKKAGPYHLMMGGNPVHIFTFQAGGAAE